MRIGVLGLTHDHVWGNLKELAEQGQARLVGAADPHQELRDKFQSTHGGVVHERYEALLDKEQLDAVFVFGDNATGVDLTELAAERGLHVMIEKPMASTLEGADRMLQAVRNAGVRLMINWPFAWWSGLQRALELAKNGDLGEIWQVKYRAAHKGPKEYGCSSYFCDWLYDSERNGAGALMDYCCYGAVLARTLLGVPSKVTAVAGRLRKETIMVEDNAILIMTYPRALALAEASWTQIGDMTSYVPMLYGSAGSLVVEPKGRLVLATLEHPMGREIDNPKQTPELSSASAHFMHCLKNDKPFTTLCEDRAGRDAQEILEAGVLSSRSGTEVGLPLPIVDR